MHLKSEKQYLIINKRTKMNNLIRAKNVAEVGRWMVAHLDLSDDYLTIPDDYFESIKAILNEIGV